MATSLLPLLSALLFASPAQQELTPGVEVRGRLEQGDSVLSSGEYADHYTFRGRRGQRVRITMRSDEFDTYLAISGPNNYEEANDDAEGLGTNSRLEIELPADGTYRIQATTYEAGHSGAYTLLLELPGQDGGEPITPGVEVRGRLDQGDSVLPSGEYADYYTFRGRRGQRVRITMRSSEFDTYLGIFGPDNYQDANDDARGLRLNSRLDIELPSDGTFRIQATSASAGQTGAYTLLLETDQTDESDLPPVARLQPGARREGRLEATDPRSSEGTRLDVYEVIATPGTWLEIRLEGDFDTFLRAIADGSVFENDDADGTNSRLIVETPASGRIRVIATSYRADETGDYVLSIRETAPRREVRRSIAPGDSIRDALTETDPLRPGGQPYRVYEFDISEPGRITIRMEAEFDTYLILRAPDGEEFTNDDADGTNSRIEADLTTPGRYEIIATSYRAGASGPFRLEVSGIAEREGEIEARRNIAVGDEVSGRLEDGDTTLRSGEYADAYLLRTESEAPLAITVESEEFDTYLMVRGPDDFSDDNDDFAGMGRNSRIDMAARAGATYRVVVTSYRPGETGSYRLRIRHAEDAPLAEMRGRVFGVFVGITDYPGENQDLENCREDAEKLAAAFRQTGLLAEQSVVLTDSAATRDRIRSAFRSVARAAGPQDVFIFFYSGHGGQTGSDAEGEPDGVDETLETYDGAITDNEVAEWFRDVRARLAIIALDSCHAGGFARDVITRPNRMGIFSCEEDVTSNVASKFQAGGYLSYFLRSGITGEADNDPADGVILVGELTQYLRAQWARHVGAESVETSEGARTYQNLVIERGGVKVTEPLLALPR